MIPSPCFSFIHISCISFQRKPVWGLTLESCYFKVTDTKAKKKLSLILTHMSEDCRLPLWKTESNEYMIKVKQKYAPKILICDTDLTVQLTFKYYCMDKDDKLLQGYYTLMKLMNKSENESENEDDD